MSELVLLSTLDEGVAQLMVNREARRNALNSDVLESLIDHFQQLADSTEHRVIVLTGAGEKAFCAGGDLSPSAAAGGMLSMHSKRHLFVDLFQTMRNCGKPIIARVQGHCLAGGIGLMLACDLAIAAERATFGTPEIKRGLFPMMIMAQIFRNVGRKKGMEMVLTGDRYDAHQAAQMGLINKAVPNEELDTEVLAMAKKIAGYSSAILRLGRDAFYTQEDMAFTDALNYLQGQLTINTLAEDAAEGVMSFFQKRDPVWKGR